MQKRKYKVLAVDLDGTLLNTKHKISEKDSLALQKMREAGVKLIVVTGRSREETNAFRSELNLVGDCAIFQGGSEIVRYEEDRILSDFKIINLKDRRLLYRVSEAHGFYPLVYMGEQVYSKGKKSKEHQYFEEMMSRKILYIDDLDERQELCPIGKISMLVREDILTGAEEDMIAEGLEANWGRSHVFGTDICARSKRQALREVLHELGIDREELIAVGDSDNDIEMIEFAGLGVAMENATNLMKQKADVITFDNDCGGVANIIEKYILNE